MCLPKRIVAGKDTKQQEEQVYKLHGRHKNK